MKTLRIIGVPEHFNYPFRILEKNQPFLDKGIKIQWIDESRGSGQMNQALRSNEADIAILLTESFLKDIEAGNPAKMIGYHVETPLNWGIHLRSTSPLNELSELDKKHFLISRMGSGSHLMALVLANREGWKPEELTFEEIGNMDGAKDAMVKGSEGVFLWEKYTTAPMVKNGTMKRINEVPSPWPCFVIAATDTALADFGDFVFEVRDEVYKISHSLSTAQNCAEVLADFYQLEVQDVEKWLEQTQWCFSPKVSRSKLHHAMGVMKNLAILKKELPFELFLVSDRLEVVD